MRRRNLATYLIHYRALAMDSPAWLEAGVAVAEWAAQYAPTPLTAVEAWAEAAPTLASAPEPPLGEISSLPVDQLHRHCVLNAIPGFLAVIDSMVLHMGQHLRSDCVLRL